MPAIIHPPLHDWDLTPAEATRLQTNLARQINTTSAIDLTTLRMVAGVDVSVRDRISQAAIVVMAFPAMDILETATAQLLTPMPYIPGLLSFREGPVVLKAYSQLATVPDILIFDGQGIAHPRKLGIAAHIGLWINRPTVGCAKNRLFGTHESVGQRKGDNKPLLSPSGKILGKVLRTRTNVKPVYVSPGHLCDIASATELVLACATKYRLPEPIRAADHLAGLYQHTG